MDTRVETATALAVDLLLVGNETPSLGSGLSRGRTACGYTTMVSV